MTSALAAPSSQVVSTAEPTPVPESSAQTPTEVPASASTSATTAAVESEAAATESSSMSPAGPSAFSSASPEPEIASTLVAMTTETAAESSEVATTAVPSPVITELTTASPSADGSGSTAVAPSPTALERTNETSAVPCLLEPVLAPTVLDGRSPTKTTIESGNGTLRLDFPEQPFPDAALLTLQVDTGNQDPCVPHTPRGEIGGDNVTVEQALQPVYNLLPRVEWRENVNVTIAVPDTFYSYDALALDMWMASELQGPWVKIAEASIEGIGKGRRRAVGPTVTASVRRFGYVVLSARVLRPQPSATVAPTQEAVAASFTSDHAVIVVLAVVGGAVALLIALLLVTKCVVAG